MLEFSKRYNSVPNFRTVSDDEKKVYYRLVEARKSLPLHSSIWPHPATVRYKQHHNKNFDNQVILNNAGRGHKLSFMAGRFHEENSIPQWCSIPWLLERHVDTNMDHSIILTRHSLPCPRACDCECQWEEILVAHPLGIQNMKLTQKSFCPRFTSMAQSRLCSKIKGMCTTHYTCLLARSILRASKVINFIDCPLMPHGASVEVLLETMTFSIKLAGFFICTEGYITFSLTIAQIEMHNVRSNLIQRSTERRLDLHEYTWNIGIIVHVQLNLTNRVICALQGPFWTRIDAALSWLKTASEIFNGVDDL